MGIMCRLYTFFKKNHPNSFYMISGSEYTNLDNLPDVFSDELTFKGILLVEITCFLLGRGC